MKRFVAPRNARIKADDSRSLGRWMLRRMPLDEEGIRCAFELSRLAPSGDAVIGMVRIMRSGNRAGRTFLPETFDALGSQYASLGAEPGFYDRIVEVAGDHLAREVLVALRDIAIDPAAAAIADADNAIRSALLRTSPAIAAREEGGSRFANRISPRDLSPRHLRFQSSSGADLRLEFTFDDLLPGRVCVVVGQNGSGKTWLLARLALCAFEPGASKDSIEGDLSLTRILAFSYSAFDEFDVPGETLAERQAYVRQGPNVGYAYFGLRDLSRSRRQEDAPLKGSRSIAADFDDALSLAMDDDDGLLQELVTLLFKESSFGGFHAAPSDEELADLTLLRRRFRRSSTGHKFVLLLMVQLAAFVRKGTLVLIDEPEAHLHPPLLVTFLTLLREVLLRRDACAVVATHSPLVVQETPARHVCIVERDIGLTGIRSPELETFGEDIGEISREVFRLQAPIGDYPGVLARLADSMTLQAIEALFPRGLSGQARGMIMARQARRRAGR
ncbi:AAA family ATPase [Brevundimonas sp.]|uniref:AAA family ATPase n=1 Tax=Brevundimonas sp. TaxID=1871086 RepID=UPI00248921F2|nr:AAA family ATPase [Brevundimonas sp.]MDI1282274.1 AAA family ATPase [Brevundimonas sp.]